MVAFDSSAIQQFNNLSLKGHSVAEASGIVRDDANLLREIAEETDNRISSTVHTASNRIDSTVHTASNSANTSTLLSSLQETGTCPITQEIMVDPVMAADGHTYERTAIEGWLGRGRRTSPMTNLPLENTILTPNIASRQTIEMLRNMMEALKNSMSHNSK